MAASAKLTANPRDAFIPTLPIGKKQEVIWWPVKALLRWETRFSFSGQY
jgi:hypothetical protein